MYNKLTLDTLELLLQNRFKEGFLSLRDLPHPSTFKDMHRATQRIVEAIKKEEKITIIGDYDVDGVTSTAIMKFFFEEINYPIEWIIPNRFKDGYGLSVDIIPKIVGTDLAITVDNGITSIDAAKLCKEKGIELIITDHHLLASEIPECYAVINQKQHKCNFPYSDICGAQIAWYLVASLKNALSSKINMMPYMELVAIAIIADMMPLKHINRVMVNAGIEALNKSTKPAIRAFLEYIKKDRLDSEDIGFFLAPLLNSAGRMDDAKYAVSFLASTNIYDARVRLERLITFNDRRKSIEQEIINKALEQADTNSNIIVVHGEDWHEGVVGIVASRVSRHYEKPSIVLSNNGKGILKGSGRSFGMCNLFDIVHRCKEYLDKFGGHSAAIGLSMRVDNLEIFKIELEKAYLASDCKKYKFDPDIVGEIDFSIVSFEIVKCIKRYAPYGEGNPTPKFISRGVEILQAERMGKNGEHLRFLFLQEGRVISGVEFKSRAVYQKGSIVDLVYRINENHFRGEVSLQLVVEKIVTFDNLIKSEKEQVY